MEYEGCEQVVNEGWDMQYERSKAFQLVQKLNRCKKMLGQWSKKQVPNNMVVIIDKLMREVAKIQNSEEVDCNVQVLEELKGRIRDAWGNEEKYWFLRARINWLNFEDQILSSFIKLLNKEEGIIKF